MPSSNAAAAFQKDLERAGIPRLTPLGKLDFHAWRTLYCTTLSEVGADMKSAQTLARHSDPRLTQNTYARAREERMAAVVEAVGKTVLPQKQPPLKSTPGAYRLAVGAEGMSATPPGDEGSPGLSLVGDEGLEPPTSSV